MTSHLDFVRLQRVPYIDDNDEVFMQVWFGASHTKSCTAAAELNAAACADPDCAFCELPPGDHLRGLLQKWFVPAISQLLGPARSSLGDDQLDTELRLELSLKALKAYANNSSNYGDLGAAVWDLLCRVGSGTSGGCSFDRYNAALGLVPEWREQSRLLPKLKPSQVHNDMRRLKFELLQQPTTRAYMNVTRAFLGPAPLRRRATNSSFLTGA